MISPSLSSAAQAAPTTARPFWRHPRFLAGFVCSLVALLYLAPLAFAALNRFECFAYANESIAYRWGHSSRLLTGDVPRILPQGFTVLAVQQKIVQLTEHFLPLSAVTLRQSLQIFSWSTFGFFIVCFGITLLAAARNPRLGVDRILLIFLPALASFYGTGSSGIYYCLLPDYYHLNAILGCVTAFLLFPLLDSLAVSPPTAPGWRPLALLGLALGLGVANKVTWAVPCLLAYGLVLLAGPLRPTGLLTRSVALILPAGLALLLVLLFCYRFDFAQLQQGGREWLAFMQGQQGSLKLWSPEFYSTLSRYNYDVLFPLELLTLLVGLIGARNWRMRVFALIGIAMFVILLWMISRRPASTTFWDINVLTTLVCVAVIIALGQTWIRRGVLTIWLVALGCLLVRNSPASSLASAMASEVASQNRFEVFEEFSRFSDGRPQSVLLLNNEYAHGGVYELLLKAAADFPTWNVSAGNAWLRHFGPEMNFYHEYGAVQLPEDLSGLCLIWFDRPDLPPLETRFEQLARAQLDPAYEHLVLPIYIMGPAKPPQIQSWAHAVRLRRGTPFEARIKPDRTPPPPARTTPSDASAATLVATAPLTARRQQPTVIELTWSPGAGQGDYEIQMAAGDATLITIGRGAVQPGRYMVGDVSATATYHFRPDSGSTAARKLGRKSPWCLPLKFDPTNPRPTRRANSRPHPQSDQTDSCSAGSI